MAPCNNLGRKSHIEQEGKGRGGKNNFVGNRDWDLGAVDYHSDDRTVRMLLR